MIGTLLVYGTLRPNNKESDVVLLKGYAIHDLGWYPGVVKTDNPEDSVVCERITVKDQDHLNDLDSYEGCHGNTPQCLYHREKVGDDWIYLYNGSVEGRPEVEDGDWLGYRDEQEGSNASLARD